METLGTILLINLATTGLMALGLTLAGRWIRRPEIMHLLWLTVLLKLVMPPVVELAVLPGPPVQDHSVAGAQAGHEHEAFGDPSGPVATIGSPTAAAPPATTARNVALGIWLVGSMVWLALAVLRGLRFHRAMRRASTRAVRSPVQDDADALAREMGLRGAPELRLVRARISPMLWCWPGSLNLLLPVGLLDRLRRGERDALIAHELAHLRRRDHWVRYLELAVMSLFWWNPVVWWVRRQMRLAEERSCDGWVLRALPDRAADYAEGLLKTVEFLSGSPADSPALASGVGRGHKLESRLTMILTQTNHRNLSLSGRLVLGVMIVSALAVFPGRGHGDTGESPRSPEQGEESRALELREIELQRELGELDERRVQLQHELATLRARRQAGRLELEADAMETAARKQEAEELRRRIGLLEHRELQELETLQLEQQRVETVRQLEQELRSLQLELGASASGEDAALREAAARARALELALERSRAESQEQAHDRSLAMLRAEIERVEQEHLVQLELALAVLNERIEEAERQGRSDEAEELRRAYRDLLEDSRRQRHEPTE